MAAEGELLERRIKKKSGGDGSALFKHMQASAVDLIGEGLAAKFFFSQAMVARKKALQKKEREEAKSKEQ